MKRIILFLLVLGSLAASAPPKASCNKAVQGSSFCAEHQRPTVESRKVELAELIPCGYLYQDGGVNGQWHVCTLPVQVPFLHCGLHGGASPPSEN